MTDKKNLEISFVLVEQNAQKSHLAKALNDMNVKIKHIDLDAFMRIPK